MEELITDQEPELIYCLLTHKENDFPEVEEKSSAAFNNLINKDYVVKYTGPEFSCRKRQKQLMGAYTTRRFLGLR